MGTTFLTTLAGGMMAALVAAPLKEVSWRFLRVATLVAVAVLTVSTATQVVPWSKDHSTVAEGLGSDTIFLAMTTGTLFALVASVFARFCQTRPHGFKGLCLLSAVSSLFAACALALLEPVAQGPHPLLWAAIVLAQLTAAFLLGTITVAWLLGHAYLTATKMTIAPLRRFTRLLSLAIVIRAAAVLVLFLLGWAASSRLGIEFPRRVLDAWLIVMLRILVGLAGSGVFIYMVVDCVRLRSTQSATGILYFGSIFAYVGELCALQFLHSYGWPM